jgi:hypothetical protein
LLYLRQLSRGIGPAGHYSGDLGLARLAELPPLIG